MEDDFLEDLCTGDVSSRHVHPLTNRELQLKYIADEKTYAAK